MKFFRWIGLALVFLFLSACGGNGVVNGSTPSRLPTAAVTTIPAPSTDATISAFLDALQVEDFASMYKLLSQASQAAISEADFAKHYTDALDAMGVSQGDIEYTIQSSLTNPTSAQVAFHLTYKTALFGEFQRDFNVNLVLENNEWHLQWDDGLILPELAGGKHLQTNYLAPARGDIYDRNGNAIATTTDVYALGLEAGAVSPENVDAVINTLARITGTDRTEIRNKYEGYNAGDYVPVGEASVDAVNRSNILAFGGVIPHGPYTTRFYVPNTAPNVTGYVTPVFAEEVEAYKRLGIGPYDTVGRNGIESWGQPYLGGRDAATLSVYAADGTKLSDLAQVNAQPSSSITLTIDSDFQQQVQAAMDGLPGAAVVMEVNTGRVLAMVSSPGFDVNLFDGQNYNRSLMPQPDTFNRAAQGQYPLGSVFKIISMAAALESGAFTAESTLDCQYTYNVAGTILSDWTWMDCQDEMRNNGTDKCPSWPPSGMLTLPEGLMRSCDPWFYDIGYTLWQDGQAGTVKPNFLSDMARAFGLGSKTGIEQIGESSGNIPNPTDGLDATSIAIGQGKVQVTPLQVARYIAAVANGGTLYRPQLVEKIQPTSGDPLYVYKPQASGTLPVTPEHLKLIQDAMREVAVNKRGTAYYTLGNFGIPTAAKTGTAETGTENPNAWFAGYSLAGKPDKPDIAVAVIVEKQGEGAIWAAPIFRGIMEIYFYGHRQTVYPRWESSLGVLNPDYGQPAPTATPEP
jgi:cell division protein FtsI/penicillin-binding protein 2